MTGTRAIGNSEVDFDSLSNILASGNWSKLDDADGFFAGIYKSDQDSLLFCDRLGIYPLYYCTHDHELSAAPSMEELTDILSSRLTPSREGLLSLLVFGHHFGDETVFEEIRRCQGGQILRYSNATAKTSSIRWRKPHVYSNSVRSDIESQSAEAFVHAVETAIKDQERVIIPLSGGFDSRVVLGAALECVEARRILAVTFGGEDAVDFQVGRMVANKAGVKSIAFPIGEQIFDEGFQRERALDYAYGYSAFATQPQEMIDFLAREMSAGCPSIWGVGGDAITGSHLHPPDLTLKPCKNLEEFVCLLIEKRASLSLHDVAPLLGLDQHEAIEIIVGLLERSSLEYYEQPWQFLDAWDIFVRGMRELISVLPFSGQLWRCPHLSREYFDLVATQDFNMKVHQSFYRRMLASRYQSLFDLPSKRGRPLLTSKWWDLSWSAGHLSVLANKGFHRITGRRDDGVIRNYGKDPSWLAREEGQKRLFCSIDVLVQRGIIRQEIDEAFESAKRNIQLARMLITVGYAFEK